MNTRDIKFRVCYTAPNGSKTIHYNDERHLITLNGVVLENYGVSSKEPLWENVFDGEAFLQQYTGEKDKDGTEIYEGDKIEYKGRIGVVEFFSGMYILNWNDQTDHELSYLQKDDIKIIGNVFLD